MRLQCHALAAGVFSNPVSRHVAPRSRHSCRPAFSSCESNTSATLSLISGSCVLRWITPLTASDHSFAGLWDIPDIQMRHIYLAAASNVRTIEGLPNPFYLELSLRFPVRGLQRPEGVLYRGVGTTQFYSLPYNVRWRGHSHRKTIIRQSASRQ